MTKTDRGNILFLILLAVVLFAALSYAVTSSMRGGGKSASSENADAAAADIINYTSLVENEIKRMMLVYDLRWDQINLYNKDSRVTGSTATAYGTIIAANSNCTTALNAIKPCHLFTDAGGFVPSRNFEKYAGTYWLSSGNVKPGLFIFGSNSFENVGTTASELYMFVGNLDKSVCDAINTKLGLPLASTQPSIPWGTGFELGNWQPTQSRPYSLEFTNYSYRLPGIATAYIGKPMFCASVALASGYAFFHVLVER